MSWWQVMESVYLRTLVEVVKAGSLSRAADTLCVTQPAVSRRIKFMEEQYGYPLLDRSGPRLRPTQAGLLVYRKAETLLAIEAELVDGLRLLGGKTRISFGSSAAFGVAHLPAVFREFMLTHGESADLQFVSHTPEQILEGVTEGVHDVAVLEVCDRFDISALRSYPLPPDEMVFVSAPSLGVPTPRVPIELLQGLPFFARREGCCSRMLLETNLARVGRELSDFHKVIVFDDLHLVVEGVLRGEAVSFLSRDIVAEHLVAGRLQAHYVDGFEHSRNRSVVLSHGGEPQGAVRDFVEIVLAHFGVSFRAANAAPSPAAPAIIATETAVVLGAGPVRNHCAEPGCDCAATVAGAPRPPRGVKPLRRAAAGRRRTSTPSRAARKRRSS